MANGNFLGGDGSPGNPYLIEDAHDLNAIRKKLKSAYRLVNDIDLNISPYNGGEGWIPIENFGGILDGDGFFVDNLYINSPKDYVGFFGGNNIDNAYTIKNIGVTNVNITTSGQWDHGVLGGRVSGGLFENCFTTGHINVSGNTVHKRIGGIIGAVMYRTVTIKNCYSLCEIGNASMSGGLLCGVHSGICNIQNSYYAGVLHQGESSGNIVGVVSGTLNISNSYYDAQISEVKDSNGYGVGLSTQEMQTAQTFIDAGWLDVLNNEGIRVWLLSNSKYPKLWFETKDFFLIESNDKYYTLIKGNWTDTELTEPLTKLDFETHGISSLSAVPIEKWGELADSKLLVNTEKQNPAIQIKSIPKPQIAISTGDIFLKMLEKIYSFTLYSNENKYGDIKVIFSINEGVNWLTYNLGTGKFEEIDINKIIDVKEKGIDPDTLNLIGLKWNDVILDSKIRFAYYLEIDSINDIAEVDKLEIKMDMHGRWKKLASSDYSYEYDNEHIYISFFKDGSYKINYQG